jgi:DNA repair exonuclease SbcCD ATPase subunit
VSEDINKTEPVAPTVAFVRHAGDTSGRTADYDAYMQDLEERAARTAAFEAQRQQNKPQEPKVELSAIDAALIALEEAAQDFEGPNGYGKPNQPLIDAKLEVERLRGELATAEDVLAKIEARGDSVQRLINAIGQAEAQLQSLVSKAESAEILRLAEKHYGWKIGWDRVSPEMKRDFKNHASVMAFKKFYISRSIVLPGQQPSVDALQRQIDTVGQKLAELREYLANSDGKTNAR